MNNIRQEYQELIKDAEEKGIRESYISFLRRKYKMWSRDENIRDEFAWDQDSTREEKLDKLSRKYHTSKKNIERILALG